MPNDQAVDGLAEARAEAGAGGRDRFARQRLGLPPVLWALRSVLWAYGDVPGHLGDRLGIGATDVRALELLVDQPDLGPADLAVRLGITGASATALVDRLEGAGHVRRSPHSHDRRRVQLQVNASAIEALFDALQPLFDGLSQAEAALSDHDRDVVTGFLTRVAAVYETYTGAR